MTARNMTNIPVIYFVPKMSKHISLYLWDQCNMENVILQTVPYNVYSYLITGNMGVFEKVEESFYKVASKV